MTASGRRSDRTGQTTIINIQKPRGEAQRVITSYNYDSNAGRGSKNFADANATWRSALLGTVAAGAMWVASARPASASNCPVDTSTPGLVVVNCTVNASTTAIGDHVANGAAATPAQSTGTTNDAGNLIGEAGIAGSTVNVGLSSGVTLNSTGDIAHGIFAETTGGRGAYANSAGGAGVGGVGGNGGSITVNAFGIINAEGADASGIAASSFGGLGGDGESISYNSFTRDGRGGNGGAITITSSSIITSDATGIFAESVGAAGGNAQLSDGTSENAGNGGAVTITSTGNITSESGNGIEASSRGGAAPTVGTGGTVGTRGSAGAGGAITITSSGDIAAGSRGISAGSFGGYGGAGASGYNGGAGGDGANGAAVTITSSKSIEAGSDGIYARSAGGDGGRGGNASGEYGSGGNGGDGGNSGSVNVTNDGDITSSGGRGIAAFAFGGFGGFGGRGYDYQYGRGQNGSGGEITIKNTGTITTTSNNYYASGIQAATSNGGSINIDNKGSISTQGQYAPGIFVGCGECSGNGGAVTITSSGDITTAGNGASGILVYNRHGRYYRGGYNSGAVGDVVVTNSGNITLNGTAGEFGAGIAVSRGSASDSDVVSVTNSGTITTKGASGIFARTSYGYTDITNSGTITITGANSSTRGIYAGTGGGGEGDATATVTNAATGIIVVTGDNSTGIYANTYEAEGRGDATIINNGKVTVSGKRTTGAYAYAYDGKAVVTNSGSIVATGDYSTAVLAEAYGQSIVTNSGTITASGDYSTGIEISSNGDTTINNLAGGTITATGLYALAIDAYGSNSAVVNNAGTVTGSVSVVSDSEQPAEFNNLAGGVFNSGEYVGLDWRGTLTNDGTLDAAGKGTVGTSYVLGNLKQNAGGTLGVDIDHVAGTSDLIEVGVQPEEGTRVPTNTAILSGLVLPHLISFDQANVEKTFTILTATGGVTINGLSVTDTALIDYTLLYPDANTVQLTLRQLALDTDGLSPNQVAVLDYILGNQSDMPDDVKSALAALFGAADKEALSKIADQLYANTSAGSAGGAMQSSRGLGQALRSCPVAEGPYGQIRETACLWAKPEYRRFTQDADIDTARIQDNTRGISGGFQTALGQDLWGGFGGSIEDSDTRINGTTKTDGTLWQLGGVLKWVQGPLKVSGSVTAGRSNLDSDRAINIPGVTAVASSSTDLTMVTGLARFAYAVGMTGFYVTPMVDVGVTHLEIDGYTETGAGGLGLTVAGLNETIWSVSPAIEIGSTFNAGFGTVRPYIKAGVTFLSEDGFTTSSQFAGAPAGISPFRTTSRFDDVFGDISAGVQFFGGDGVNLRLNYDGHIGENSEQHGVDAKVTVNY